MNSIGFVGLGKLGLTCATAMSAVLKKEIYGYDINKEVKSYIHEKKVPFFEKDIDQYLNSSQLIFEESIESLVLKCKTIFIAVQTPHENNFEGITPLPDERKDFDYSFLIKSVKDIKDIIVKHDLYDIDIVVISTVLPGTMSNKILPILKDVKDKNINLVYNPYFIAMGTTIEDFLNPEFVILGSNNLDAQNRIKNIYDSFINKEKFFLTYEEAELVKVSYNTFIGLKIIFANTLSEITESIGGNVDNVTRVLSNATDRLISSRYLSAGMGDGGGCHPRDQIAMSYMAKKYNLSYDIFESIAKARDLQTKRHADIIKQRYRALKYPVVILGEAYKKNINLTLGSPSKLLQHYLKELSIPFTVFDPIVYPEQSSNFEGPHIFYVATPHDVFRNLALPLLSRVLDPWGSSIKKQYSVLFEYLGRDKWG